MSIKKTYIYANSQVIAQHDGDYEADRYFYLHDRLGSVRQIIDTNGDVNNRYTFKPFGELFEGSDHLDVTVSNPFGFAGQYYDSEIEQYYLRARQYDPHLQIFTSIDPVLGKFEEPLTLHEYLYCLNDPINKIDPSGEFFGFLDLLLGQGEAAKLRARTAAIALKAKAQALSLYNRIYIRSVQINILMAKLFGQSISSSKESVTLPGRVLYYTPHGASQALGRDVGRGVAEWAMLEAIAKPVAMEAQSGGRMAIWGQNAVVVLNEAGEVITTWALHSVAYANPFGG